MWGEEREGVVGSAKTKLLGCILILQRICFLHISSSCLYQGKDRGIVVLYAYEHRSVLRAPPKGDFYFQSVLWTELRLYIYFYRCLKG